MSVILASLNSVKNILRIPLAETALDTALSVKIITASAKCENVTNRSFTYKTYSNDTYSGAGQRRIVLRNYPVDQNVPFLLQYLSSWSQIGSYDSTDYAVKYDSGIVTLLGGLLFPRGPSSVYVGYSAGYRPAGTDGINTVSTDPTYYISVPDDLTDAVARYAVLLYRDQQGEMEKKEVDQEKDSIQSEFLSYGRIAA